MLGALLRLGEHALGLLLGLGEHLLALLDDPARLLDLLGDRGAHLVEDVVDLLAVDHDAVGERHRPCVVDDVIQFVDENEDVHTQQPSLGSPMPCCVADRPPPGGGRRPGAPGHRRSPRTRRSL